MTAPTKKRALARFVALSLFCSFVVGGARAQTGPDNDPDRAQGYVDNVFHHASVDSVNLYNGQLTIPIALGPNYPVGPKLKFQAMLVYNSRFWDYGHPPTTPPDFKYTPLAGNPALGAGWTFTLGAIKFCAGLGYCYQGPDGSEHGFDMLLGNGYSKTLDGSQLMLHDYSGGAWAGPYEMWDADGNRHYFGHQVIGYDDAYTNFIHDFGLGRDGWYLSSLTDPFGNGYTVTYRTGTSPRWDYDPASPCTDTQMLPPATTNTWIPQSINLPTGTITVGLDANLMINTFGFPVLVGGVATTATWTLNYQTEVYSQNCGGAGHESLVYLRELASITLPQGAGSYTFTYSPCGVPGYMRQVRLPTDATIDYSWGFYSFYHGNVGRVPAGCLVPVPTGVEVEVSGPFTCGSKPQPPTGPRPDAPPGGICENFDPLTFYLDTQYGVARRTETIPVPGSSSISAITDYTQYAFPYGEQGMYGDNRGPQNVTVVLFPADVDGRRRAKAVLFWGGPLSGQSYQGDRTGADLEERVFDSDPNYTGFYPMPMPVCGGVNDTLFCPNHAARVTQRTYEYDSNRNRRLLSEVAFHQSTASNGACSSCRYHRVDYGPSGSWEVNGRHYPTETHSGNLDNLGNDSRTITTAWLPSNWMTPNGQTVLPNLYTMRTESDSGPLLIKRYFYFDSATGFLNGSSIWEPAAQPQTRLFLTCQYQDTGSPNGTVRNQVTLMVLGYPEPTSNPCFTRVSDFSTIGSSQDLFARQFSYQNGLLTSAQWMTGPTSTAAWSSKRFTRDFSTGWITASYDTAGFATSNLYDAIGRVTSITPPGGEAPTSVGYSSATRTTASRNGGPGLSIYEQYDYDGLGRTTRETRQMPGVNRYAVRYHSFDAAGHQYFDSEWGSCTAPTGDCQATPLAGTTSSDFDPFGRPRVIQRADGARTTISYADSYSSYSDTKKTVTASNINGACTGSCSGGTSADTIYVSDAFGRLASVTEPGGTDTTSYAYDVNDKLTQVVQGSQMRTFLYDAAGNLRQETTPERGQVSYNDATGVLAYGSLGNILRECLPDGILRVRSYDFAGRTTQLLTNEGGGPPSCAQPAGRVYLQNLYSNSGSGPALGRLFSRTTTNYAVSPNPTVTDTFGYDSATGRLASQQTQVLGSQSLTATQSWKYNGLGLVAHHYHPRVSGQAPFVVSTGYDAGLPVTEYVNGIPMVTGVGYHPSGALGGYRTGVNIGGVSVGQNVTTTISPDATGMPRPASISTSGASSNFLTGTYFYDGAGNIVCLTSGANCSSPLDSFTYDSRSRLTSATLSGAGSQSFSYDQFGNLLTKTGTPGNITFCSPSCTNNRLPGSVAAYDGRGNITTNLIAPGGTEFYTFDGLDRQIAHSTGSLLWNYLYDGENERVAKIFNGSSWTYTFRDEGKRVSAEYGSANPSRDNVFLGTLLAVSYASAPGSDRVWTFYSSDHLGTPRLITDLTGAAVETPKNWPYGENVAAQGSFQRIRFASMERDTEASRYHDHARGHEFNLGRFLSPDKVGGHEGDPQSWNRYAYGRGNPIKYLDPDGKAVQLAIDFHANAAIRDTARTVAAATPVVGDVGAFIVDAVMAPFFPTKLEFVLNSLPLVGEMVIAAGPVNSVLSRISGGLSNLFTKNLERDTVVAAARESVGEVVSQKASGVSFNHLTKFNEARAGATQKLEQLKSLLGRSDLTAEQRYQTQQLLSEYSKRLDQVEKQFQRAACVSTPENSCPR